MKDLPKVFANPIDKGKNHNNAFSYGKLDSDRSIRNERNVIDKINKLFKSERTTYSIDCLIKFENKEEKHTIIGKTSNNLVTKHQELIPIREIYDIELA